ncbi:MAG: hypothetical protein HY908_21830 [Myxococcales bacterium]|nr:hypothetical protein [Myxococcales bacterium]
MASSRRLSCTFALAALALSSACAPHAAPRASLPTTPLAPGSVLVMPRAPAPPPFAEPPPVPAPPNEPWQPEDPAPAPGPHDECQRDADCASGFVCGSRIVAACPTCDGGPVVRVCVAAAAS